jgi:hypothetical protein
MQLKCKKRIVEWIKANPGFVYNLFTFVSEHKDEILPSEEEFETLTYNISSWEETDNFDLDENEKSLYPGATKRYRFKFSPLNEELIAHVFTNENFALYVVVTS